MSTSMPKLTPEEESGSLFHFDPARAWDYENGFYLTSHVTRLAKALAQYELYKSILHLPGQVVECGVYKGVSLVRLATYREMLESPYSRKLLAFDVFGKFPKQDNVFDARFIASFEQSGGDGIPVGEMRRVFEHKAIQNVELIEGDVLVTVPAYRQQHPELKIALLHVDVSVYEPSLVCLRELYDLVVKGGIVMLDDFATVAGETRAIDEFFADKDVLFEKLPISHIPAFIRK